MAEIIGRVGWKNYVSPTSATNPLWNSLVAYYTGDNTPNDAKGTANGTLVNGATYSTGKINNGFSLDGVNDYVSIPNGTFNPTSGSYTISAWMSLSYNSYLPVIFGLGSFTNNSIVVYVYGGLIRFLNSNGATYQLIESPLPSLGVLHHVLCVKDTASNKYYLYVNGSLVAQATISINYVANSLETRIGSIGNGTHGFSPFAGIIDEVGLWNRALTATEAAELYNGGAGKQYLAPAPAYTTRTTAFAAATGITDTTILNALNTFDTGLISNGLDTKMKALYPFVGGTAVTHKYNFMDARDSDAAFRLAFNGGWVHSSTGAQPNGTNGYANTYFNHVNNGNDKNNFGLTIYSRTNSTGYKVDIGAVDSDSYSWIAPRYNSTIDFVGIYDNSWFYGNYVTSSLGLFTALRNSLTSQKFFQNGILKGQRTGFNTQANINLNIYISCRNLYSVASNFSDRQLAFSGIHDSLTDAEALTFYNLVQAMQTSLSRQV